MTRSESVGEKISPHLSCLFHIWFAEQEAGMEEWGTDGGYDVLGRIVALLFSLADLADIAAGLPASRRRYLLDILGVAEAEAHGFLIGIGAPVSAGGQDTADDALRMAARLRALAMLLIVMLAQRFELLGAVTLCADRERTARMKSLLARLAAPDTS